MPLLKRKDFEKTQPPEKLRDDEEVFFCEVTKEVFRNYEDYFERVMLTSSMVWTCQYTGKPNLTYSEALDSEREAKQNIRNFPRALRGPLMLTAAQTKRSAISELIDDVFGYIKERFFDNERVDVLYNGKYRCCTIVEVMAPANSSSSSPVKHDKFRYKVKAVDDKSPPEWVAIPENIKRDKGVFTKDKCKLFLKQHIESSNNMLKVKESSLHKYVRDQNITAASVFVGKPPDFQLSKRLVELEAKRKDAGTKTKKQKQPSIQKYLNKSDSSSTPGSATSSKPKTEKQKAEDAKKLREEMERVRKEKEEKEVERKKRLEEEKAELNAQVNSAIKDLNSVREDLELTDQKVLPKPTRIVSLIGDKRFGDFIQILEFMHTFADLLCIKDKFPHGVTTFVLERALLFKEINGPLTDILQVLLSTIFSLQIEEKNEVAVSFDPNAELSVRRADAECLREAARAGIWCEKHFSTHLNELPMDTHTLSELLRLHFLSSGALVNGQGNNWRYQHRGGYLSHDDPGFQFCLDEPQIIRTLAHRTVFELPQGDIIKIIRCLMDQILTYSSVRDLVEERLEKAQKSKYAYRLLCFAEKRREEQVQKDKRELREELKKALKEFSGPKGQLETFKTQKEDEMEKKFIVLDRQSEVERSKFEKEAQKLKEEFFDYQVFLGSDRAGRNYWLFESLPGIFVEHNTTFAGRCVDTVTEHNPGLASCPAAERSKFIRQMVVDRKNNDKENKADNVKVNGIVNKEKVASGKLSQADLMMCTANAQTCPVHAKEGHPDHIPWGYFSTTEELDALIAGLNPRGYREKPLRETLEVERELIINHIEHCQTTWLVRDDHEIAMRGLTNYTSRKYGLIEEPVDICTVFDARLRTDLLEFEYKLQTGYLGEIKVTDRMAWRTAIESFKYEQQCDTLTWGPSKKLFKLTNGHAAAAESDDELNESKESDETTEGAIEDARYGNVSRDPGHNLGDKKLLEAEDSQDELVPVYESPATKELVQSLASALLQTEQGIDGKFMRHPFGPKGNRKQTKNDPTRKNKLERWEESLMRSTSYSQIFLHFNILSDAIVWSRSATRQYCYVCRRAKDPEYTLLCDECNRGYHTYCLKPKLKTIPEGDWFCPRCRPEDYVVKRSRKRKIFTENEDDEVEEANESQTLDEKPSRGRKRSRAAPAEEEEAPKKRRGRKPKVEEESEAEENGDEEQEEDEEEDEEEEEETPRTRRGRRRKVEESEVEEESEEEEEEVPKKRRGRKRKLDQESESEEIDDEPLVKKLRRGARRSKFEDSDEDEPIIQPRNRRSRRDDSSDDDAGKRRRRTNQDENLTLHTSNLYALLTDISKHPSSWPFNRPVSIKEVPDYYKIIKHPMDFARVKSRLNMGDYKTDYDLMSDIQLVFANCDLYNSSSSEIYKTGIELERFVQKKCKEYKIPFRPSDMLTNGRHTRGSTESDDDDDEPLVAIKEKSTRNRTM